MSTFGTTAVTLVGSGGQIRTSTSGTSFTGRTSGTTDNIYCVAMASASFFVAAGANGYLRKSSDSGSTWLAMIAFGSSYSALFHSLSVLSTTTAYVAATDSTSGSVIYRTTNMNTWTLFVATTSQLHSLSMLSATVGLAGGMNGGGVLTLVNCECCLLACLYFA